MSEIKETKNQVDDLPAKEKLNVLLTLILFFLILGFSGVIGVMLYLR